MKSTYICRLLAACSLPFLSGCGRIVDWSKSNFYQGDELVQYAQDPQSSIRSIRVYDQFTTRAFFDVMWLSDGVKIAYANANALRFGKSDALRKAFLRRQLEENRHFITFYVSTNKSIILGDSASFWSLFLKIHDVDYQPQEIKLVELAPEYQVFFGKKFNRFKQVYEVKFSMRDADGKSIITPETTIMTLYFRSLEKQATLDWAINPNDFSEEYKELPA